MAESLKNTNQNALRVHSTRAAIPAPNLASHRHGTNDLFGSPVGGFPIGQIRRVNRTSRSRSRRLAQTSIPRRAITTDACHQSYECKRTANTDDNTNERQLSSLPNGIALSCVCGMAAISIPVPHQASRSPSPAPKKASMTLSVSSCEARRLLPAPSAARIANSLLRPVARTMSRLATFAQAISSSTNPTAPKKREIAAAIAPGLTMRSRNGTVTILISEFC